MLANRMTMGAAGVSAGGGGLGGIDEYTVLYLPMTGSDESTTFTDSGGGANCPHTVTAVADAQVETGVADPWGGYSGVLLLDGTGDYLTTIDSSDWDLFANTDDSTIDFWIKFTDHVGIEYIICQSDTTTNEWWLRHAHGTGFVFAIYNSATQVVTLSPGGEITDTNWHHIALVKNGTVYRLFVDGSQVGTATDADVTTVAGIMTIGAYVDASNAFSGEKAHLRISKGIDRTQDPSDPMYNGGTPGDSFTPPTGPYTE